MRLARRVSPLAVTTLTAAVLLAACSRRDGEAAPTASSAPGYPINPELVTPSSATPATTACGGEACGDACTGESCSGHDDHEVANVPALRRVAADQVCMRTNRFLGKTQRRAEVEGRAYFGCCPGCTRHLGENAAARTAKDPVTGEAVDKASAVVGARPDGTVVYFASEETFARGGGA